ncbi:hypothetical protein SlGVgp044 [Spodoptera litura granulovirus]|uniref:Uncharacterized protein n=1 Tax=Spodoptera litura granulovirus TaxID=359919 RepID=A5IZP6_9BBAC|nr:hypothetical protein SlGVgp044 [Spodoptera litura granulovirus]ABQ51987.1 hypothetical protein SlGVgp044 [Spodoptera litura granulovirus]
MEHLSSKDYTYVSPTFGTRDKYLLISHTDVMDKMLLAKKTFEHIAKTHNICISLDYVEQWDQKFTEADSIVKTFKHLPIMIGDYDLFKLYPIDINADDYEYVQDDIVKNKYLNNVYYEMKKVK